jgi:hypothetical protein
MLLAALAVSCARSEPSATAGDLNWACGARRCTASFRVNSDASRDEPLLVVVRAYAGDSVASREIVGEHRQRLVLPAGQSRPVSATFETRRPATRVRVILQRAG